MPPPLPFPVQAHLISQVDLENILQLDGQIERTQSLRDEIAARVLRRLSNGDDIEPGRRTIDVVEDFAGSIRTQKLKVR